MSEGKKTVLYGVGFGIEWTRRTWERISQVM